MSSSSSRRTHCGFTNSAYVELVETVVWAKKYLHGVLDFEAIKIQAVNTLTRSRRKRRFGTTQSCKRLRIVSLSRIFVTWITARRFIKRKYFRSHRAKHESQRRLASTVADVFTEETRNVVAAVPSFQGITPTYPADSYGSYGLPELRHSGVLSPVRHQLQHVPHRLSQTERLRQGLQGRRIPVSQG